MELSRRNFLVGAASAGVLGAMAGLTGCAPQASSASAKSGDVSSADAAVARPTYYMCDEDWLGSAPEIADADIKETKSFDVVVVGGGHAGTQAALAAAQEGAKVAVIEKHNDGEIVYRGDDICSYNSKMLEAWGFGPYDLDEIVNEYVRRANGRCNTEVIRSFVYNSGEMMDNLASLIPDTSDVFDYEGGQCIVQIAYDKPSGADYPVEVSGYKMWASTVQTVGTKNEQPVGKKQKTGISRLAEIEEYCRDAAEDLGAEWFCGQTAARCVQDADGAVKGIIAEDADGNYVKFEAAKGVILATGDFGGNTDMVWELCSECAENAERHGVDRAELMGMTDCDGSGHKIGCWAGGAIESHPRLENAKTSVERYNELCAAGKDTDFGKPENLLIPIDEGPFFIATQGTNRLYGPGLNTLAGLCVNGDYQVLTASKSEVIKGLYAVGNTMGERYGNAYNCPSAGNNMGNAMTSGRVAGKHAATA